MCARGITSAWPLVAGAMSINAIVCSSSSTILQDDASPQGVAQLLSYLGGDGTSALGMLSGENFDERVRSAAYLTMAMPAYQLS